MSNKIYDENFFNEEQKERYLKGLQESTYKAYSRILKRASNIEEQLNKDLYNFNLYEIGQVMKMLAPTTISASNVGLASMKGYIDWAIKNDLRDDNINPLSVTMTDEFVRSFVDTTNQYLFSYDEIISIIGRMANPQDSGVVLCIYEGIMGREYSEIRNILKDDIKGEENKITVKEETSEGSLIPREIEISDQLKSLLRRAALQTHYDKNNGNAAERYAIGLLNETPYVFRSIKSNIRYNDAIRGPVVWNRIKAAAEWFGYPYLNPMNIRNSGMVKYANDLYIASGKFEREEIVAVCYKFGVTSKITTRLTKSFLNLETINTLYPKE
ncbi:hypothetical protein [Paenibacillus sp. FSL E2-0178]|uniref:phage lytic cycle repressor MrpR family protein n=1 Tax=Paenibacillus sp. FSL E2-0178 TaxID=2921361 RepID=UPI0031583407